MLEFLTAPIKSLLGDMVTDNFQDMFATVDRSVSEVTTQIGTTPDQWDNGIFSMVQNLSATVVLPIAGMILTFVVCYELIQMIISHNNMHNFDTFMIFKWIMKTYIAVYVLTHTFEIMTGIFSAVQYLVNTAAGQIGDTSIGDALGADAYADLIEGIGIGTLIMLALESLLLKLFTQAVGVVLYLFTFARMLNIYILISISPIPLSTVANREWGQIGISFIKRILAIAFSAFIIVVCFAIYTYLISRIRDTIINAGDVQWATLICFGYTILLCTFVLKANSFSNSIFGVH